MLEENPKTIGLHHAAINATDGPQKALANVTSFLANTTLARLNSTHTMDADGEPVSPVTAVLLLYATLILMLGAQAGLFWWKSKHKKSYELVTLTGLWLMPAIFSVQLHFWRFILVWLSYTVVTGYLIRLCMGRTVALTTPGKVYSWFLTVHKVGTFVGISGYVMLVVEMFGLHDLMEHILPKGTALLLLWYGLYFGILNRDCAEVASDRIAASLGSGSKLTSTVNRCGICGGELHDSIRNSAASVAPGDSTMQLSCKHCFHELCIRGWTVVGKKDVCPCCLEKVDLRDLYAERPWETKNLSWIQMLDALRYMVVWNPIIFTAFSIVFHFVGPAHHPHGPPHHPPAGPPPAEPVGFQISA